MNEFRSAKAFPKNNIEVSESAMIVHPDKNNLLYIYKHKNHEYTLAAQHPLPLSYNYTRHCLFYLHWIHLLEPYQ